jgi:hypothetical protein
MVAPVFCTSSFCRSTRFCFGPLNVTKTLLLAAIAIASAGAPARSLGQARPAPEKAAHAGRDAAALRVTERTAPLAFEPNEGQDRSDASFIAHSADYLARMGRQRVSLLFAQKRAEGSAAKGAATSQLNLAFLRARGNVAVTGAQKLPGRVDYFPTGNPADWKTNISTFGRVEYRELYPGVGLSFYGREGRLEYDVDVAAGANPKAVQIAISGQSDAKLNAQGDLLLKAGDREMRFLKPVAYQLAANGARQLVEAGYRIKASSSRARQVETVSFALGKYDCTRALVIDPVLVYGEILNNSSAPYIYAMAADAAGNVYTVGSNYYYYNVNSYIQKLDPNGNVLFTAQLGNSGYGYALPTGIAVDAAGSISVSGYAYPGVIPTTANAYQQAAGAPGFNAFLAVLQSDGTALTYVSYFGGTLAAGYANGLAVDAQSKVYLAGYSNASDFPTTEGAYAAPGDGSYSFGWVAKFDPTLSGNASLLYSTALPAAQTQVNEQSIAVDSSGDAYVTGNVSGTGFPITPGAYTYNGQQVGQGGVFVTELNTTGTGLIYSANLGPGSATGIAVDGAGATYVTGNVGYNDYPSTVGAWQTSYPAGFATKLSADGSALVYSTFLSGPSGYARSGINPDSISIPPGCAQNCVATIGGWSSQSDLPLVNPIQNFNTSGGAGVLIQLVPTGASASFSSYIGGVNGAFTGGSYSNYPEAAVDGAGNIYFAGNVSQYDFPLTIPLPSSPGYGYLAKIGPANASLLEFVPGSVTFGTQTVGIGTAQFTAAALPTAVLRNVGSLPVQLQLPFTFSDSEFTETDNCPATLPSGGDCTLTFSFTPTVGGVRSGTITANGNSLSVSAQLQLSGTGQDAGFLSVSPTSLNFGDQATGTTSAAQTVTLSNIGNAPLTLGSFSTNQFTNSDATAYPQVNDCPTALNPNQSCQVSVQFAPTQLGAQGTYLYSNYQGNFLYISGVGAAPGSGGSGSLSLSSSLLNFGTETVGSTSGVQYSYLENTGTVPVSILGTSVSLTSEQGSPNDFSVSLYDPYYGLACPSLPPGISNPAETYPYVCAVSVNFTPSVPGTETATISVTDSTSSSPHTFTVSGVGVATSQTLESMPGDAVFASQPVGVTSAVQTFYFYNTGNTPIAISRVLATGDFQITNTYNECAGTTLNPYSVSTSYYCYVQVAFTPTATGVRTGTLELVDSATGTPQVFSLMGTGVAAAGNIVATPDSLTFSSQPTGTTSAAQSFTFTNTGNVSVQVNSLAFTGDFALSGGSIYYCPQVGFSVVPPFSLPVGQYCQGSIVYTPTQTSGTETGTLTIGTTAANSTINLSGPAEAATQAVGLTPTAVSFASVKKGSTAGSSNEYSIWIRNAGTEPLTFYSPTGLPSSIVGNGATPSADFAIYTAPYGGSCYYVFDYNSSILQPGQSCFLPVSFTPSQIAAESATLTLTDSAGTQTVVLSGTGVSTQPHANVDPVTLSFDQQTLTTTTPAQSYVYLYNNTSSGLTITADSISAGSSDFLITPGQDTCKGKVVAANSSCSVEITFQPSTSGLRTGTLTIKDQNSVIYTIGLAGYADAVVDQAMLDPLALAFTPQSITATNGNGLQSGQLLTLTNNGNLPITVGTLTGTDVATASVSTGDFTINSNQGGSFGSDACSNQALAPGASCSVYLGFVPTTAGAKTGSLVFPVTYQDSTTGNLTATFTGTGVTEQDSVYVTPTLATFLDQVAGYSGGGLEEQTLTLTNTSGQAISVGQLTGTDTIIGSSATGDFVASAVTVFGNPVSGYDGCSNSGPINPGGACSVEVYFAPGSTGALRGSIVFPVTFTDGATTSITANLAGNGIAVANGPTLTPGGTVFAAEVVGVTDANQQMMTLTNSGNATFTVGMLSGSNWGVTSDFYTGASGDACSGATLNPAQACNTWIAFTPSAVGVRAGTLVFPITYAGASNPVNLTATLSGTGITANQEITPSLTTMAFPTTEVGSNSSSLTLTFSNRGSLTQTINSIAVTGAEAGDFTTYNYNDQCSGQSLAPNSNCIVYLTFSPTVSGSRTATLTESDTAPGSPRVVTLKGTGSESSQIGFLPTTLAFGQGLVGAGSPEQTVGATNTGLVSTSITSVTSTVPAEFAVVDDNCSGQALAPGSTCTFGVIFSAAHTGSRSASIQVLNSAGTAALSATGTGVNELTSITTLAANPTSAAFGSLFTFTASVVDSSSHPVTAGSVSFYNGTTLLGSAQIVGTTSGGGVVGTAIYRTHFLPLGANSITAKFTGPNAASTSVATTVTATGAYPSSTLLSATGTQGSYVLTATVAGAGPATPTGSVAFTDLQTSTQLGNVALDPTTLTQGFAQGVPQSVGPYLNQPVVGDVNGDGIPDVVEVLGNGGGIAVLLGNGDGTFQPAKITTVGSGWNYLALGDFNGDGKLDVVMTTGGQDIAVLLGKGDGTFAEPVQYNAGSSTYAIAVGDFDGDGKLDLAVTNINIASVSILLGNGDGTFQPPATFATGNYPGAVATADVNGDGKLDLVVANSQDATVSVLLGNGNGTFQSQQTYPTGSQLYYAVTIAIGDVNGDNKPDLVVNNYYDSTFTVLTGNGDGTFGTEPPFSTPSNPTSVALGDLNGDGILDLAIGGADGSTSVSIGNGDGTFQTPVVYGSGTGSAWAAIADLNGDGRPDIVFTNNQSSVNGTSTVLINRVTQTATLTGVTLPGVSADIVNSTYSGDTHFAGDLSNSLTLPSNAPLGHTVLAVSPTSGPVGTIYTLTATATDSNSNPVTAGTVTFYDGTNAIATVQVVGTTGVATFVTADFVVGAHNLTAVFNGIDTLKPSTSTVHTIQVMGKYASTTTLAAAGVQGSYQLTASVDGLGYGTPTGSVVFTDTTTSTTLGTLTMSSANAVSNFLTPVPFAVGTNPYQVVSADVNNDGKMDLIVGNYNGTQVSVLLGNGDGTFQAAQSFGTVASGVYWIAVADANGDGKPDILVSNGPSITVYLGNGDGTFQAASPLTTQVNAGGLVWAFGIGDLNGDGKPDIVAADWNHDLIFVLLGNGDGTFTNTYSYPSGGSQPDGPVLADFNGDGHIDVAIANATSGTVNIFTGNGDGTLNDPQTITGFSSPDNLFVADLNHDGKPDIAVTQGGGGGSIYVLINQGNANFASPVTYAVNSGVYGVALADVTGDGVIDLVASGSNGSVGVLAGNGDGTFQSPVYFSSGSSESEFVAVGDFNGDGRNDIASVDYYTSMVSILLGSTTNAVTLSNVSLTGLGTDTVQATYSGDAIFSGSASNSLALAARPYGTTTVLAVTPTSGALGAFFKMTATVTNQSSNPVTGGQVAFYNGTQLLGTLSLVSQTSGMTLAGTATFQTAGLAVGSNSITAQYLGDAVDSASTSSAQTITVTGQYPTTTALNVAGTAGNYTLTADVSAVAPLNPTGTVTFTDTTSNPNVTLGSVPISAGTLGLNFFNSSSPAISFVQEGIGTQVVVGDFNGDGIADLAECDGSNVGILLGNGDGTFQAQQNFSTSSYCDGGLVSGDFNGDGKLDIAIMSVNNSAIGILLGNGDGTFGAPTTFPATYPLTAVVGDFNGDGKLDIVAVEDPDYGSSTEILIGNGDGTFQPAVSLGNLSGSFGATAGDFNGDGKLDLAITGYGVGNVQILLGNGDGTFASPIAYATGNNPTQVVAADFNRDGKLDLASANFGDSTFSVLLGNGDGTFAQQVVYSSPDRPWSIATADFGLSDYPDLVTSGYNTSTSQVFLNHGDGTFPTSQTYTAADSYGYDSYFVAIGDFNGDGRPDFAAMSNAGVIDVYLSQPTEQLTLNNVGVVGSGTHNVSATYSGDTNFVGSLSNSVQLTAAPVTPSVTLTAQPSATVTYGTSLSVLVAVAGPQGATQPTGTVSYTVDGGTAQNASLVSSAATLNLGAALGAGTHTVAVNYTGDTLYNPASNSIMLTVSKANQTITFNALGNVTYGASPFGLSATANSGLGVTYKVISGPATITSGNVVTITGVGSVTLEADQGGNANYNAAPAQQQTFTVGKASLTINVKNATRVYGNANPTFTGTLVGVVNGDSITATYSTSATIASPVGTYAITATPAGTALGNYSVTINNGTLTVTKTVLTVTVNNATRKYGAADPTFTGTISGLLNGDTVTATYSSTDTITSPVGTYTITATLSGAALANYSPNIVTGVLTVTTASATITVNNAGRTYGASNPAFSGTITGALNGDALTATYSTTATVTSPVGTYQITAVLGGTNSANYTATVVPGVLTINTATLNVAVMSLTKVYGSVNPTLSGTVTGLLNGDTVTTTYSTTATQYSPVVMGGYPITAAVSGSGSTNYTAVVTNGTLTVTTAVATITENPATRVYGVANPMLTGTLSGILNGDSVTAVYSTTATISSHPGTYAITATLAGPAAGNYQANVVSANLTITQATPVITWTAPAAITYGTALSGTQLDATSTVGGTFAYTPAAGTVLTAGAQTLSVTLTASDAIDYTTATATVPLTVNRAAPVINWTAPAAITYGTALSATQLNASSTVSGTFAYTPTAGTVLTAGMQTLSVTLTPADATDYTTATATVQLTVNKAVPTIDWTAPNSITYPTALSAGQLDATSPVAGAFAYTPAIGTVLKAGAQTLSATLTPTDTTDYSTVTATVPLTVNQATPVISWTAPTAIVYGTALSAAQLDATSSVGGTFAYMPAVGTVLTAGAHTLSVTLTPTDAVDYTTATATVPLTVNQATPSISWATPLAITYGTALSATQLNATSPVGGAFSYTPASGTVLTAGAHMLSATLTPTDAIDYTTATASVSLTVNQATPSINWTAPSVITYGTALSATQLDATSTVAGTIAYTPAPGAVLTAGVQTLSATLTPTDATDYKTVSATVQLTVNKAVPTINWTAPNSITYPTALSAGQLDATSPVAGAFAYTPAIGTVLKAGAQTLSATLTPTDTTDYSTVTATVPLTVNQATPVISWTAPTAIVYGTALSAAQLDATSSVGGTFAYMPAVGTVLTAGAHTLSVTLTPTDAVDYTTATATVPLTVNQATPSISWATPLAITYGTALSATQLNATSPVGGAFSYTPASGTVLTAGAHMLSATLTPTDAIDYTTATASVSLTVNQATPSINWTAPSVITYGTALSATQLDATSTVAGTIAYTPAPGAVLTAGVQTLSATLTPTDATDYTAATKTVTLTINQATPIISWTTPTSITYGTALSATQLDATANVGGTLAYTPTIGSVLTAGTQTLSVTLTPTDLIDYTTATKTVSLTVKKATPVITWHTPAAISSTTPLSSTQLDATAAFNGIQVPGTFAYTPAAGAVLSPGQQTLSAVFTPTDALDYATASASVKLQVYQPAVLTSPVPGGTFVSPSVTFTWTPGLNATGYYLWIGSTGVGSNNLYGSAEKTVTSYTFTSMPTNGETIYVRLITNFNGTWLSNDYSYTAANPAVMTSPAPGATFSGPSVTFNWTAVPSATGYYLWIGSKGVGSNNLYNSAPKTVTTYTFNSMPTNGETIYVRLITNFNGLWVSQDYAYTAVALASLTSPLKGTTFSGSSVTFDWTAVTSATNYYLFIGSTGVGSNNIYSSAPKTATTYTFNSMPTNGETIYVRLITNFSGTWLYNDYTFRAAIPPAKMTSPAAGSTLTGPSVAFTWAAAPGATGYFLLIGSTGVGSNNLYNSAEKTVTAYTFSSMPTNGELINVRLITNYSGTWVSNDYIYTAALQAAMSTPVPGSVLSGPSVPFSWSKGSSVTGYYLQIGTTGVGSDDLYDSAEKTGTSYTFTAMPTNGETIYVRLISSFSGVNTHGDYVYTAATQAVMTTPAPGTTLTGSSVTFDWTTAAGATGYFLQVGSTGVGSDNLYNSAEKTITTYTFATMPTNGEAIYVRLTTNFNGSWVHNDYTYTAATIQP